MTGPVIGCASILLRSIDLYVERIIIDVERNIPHPSYSLTKLTNDIALIKLKMPAKLNSRVETICFPAKDSKPMIGSYRCYLSGWGSIQHPGPSHHTLQQAMLPVVSNTNCFNRNSVICAGYGKSSPINACRGDSGGPFVCQKSDGSWEQHGVASFVVEYCKYYTAFAPVGDYIDWINQYISQ
ncbi:chymotrypsin-C-like [Rhopilema esculentum]|uniref:chymotrypsin-C-like n=1 Tax=Rhopilema esculentum TaxID=499914 RepID=UPI0031CE40F3